MLERIHEFTNIRELKQKLVLIYCYNNDSALSDYHQAAKKSGHFSQFIPMYSLPDLKQVEHEYAQKGIQTILCIEDLQPKISSLKEDVQGNFSSFLTRSRFSDISIIYIMHNFGYNAGRHSLFDKSFIENSSHVCVFDYPSNRQALNLFASRVFSEKKEQFYKLFAVARQISGKQNNYRAYLFITNDLDCGLFGLSRVRCDLFNENLIFFDTAELLAA